MYVWSVTRTDNAPDIQPGEDWAVLVKRLLDTGFTEQGTVG
jgi:hypothetical protein